MTRLSVFLVVILFPIMVSAQKEFAISSPDNSIKANIQIDNKINFSIEFDGREIIKIPELSILLKTGEVIGANPQIKKTKYQSIHSEINPVNYKRSTISDEYNEMLIQFKKNYALEIRAYDEGIAYRFLTSRKDSAVVIDEPITFRFPKNYNSWLAYSRGEKNKLSSSFQSEYHFTKISGAKKEEYAFLPVMIDIEKGKKLCITEVNIDSYPGMFLAAGGEKSLTAQFAAYPALEEHNPIRQQLMVKEYEDFIAKISGEKTFPWRVFALSRNDTEMADNDLVYKLASPSKIKDVSWVKPGKIAWDWWCDWNISGVDFKAGINTDTYKYYIDFAAENKLEYVVLDEGWSPPTKGDIFKIVPEIDLDEIINYGKNKNVDVILWAVWNVINEKADEACKYYSDKGIKGFKIDFIDRNDQKAVEFVHRFAAIAAKHKLIVDYHGMYQPAGLQRTYPNILNFEGVYGLEEVKWSNPDMPLYNVTMPFIRMLAGPVDYTPGTFNNVTKENFRPIYSVPMGQGTRCNQMGLFIIQDAPLVALADAPSVYKKEQECTDFITAIPTVWDETKVLDGKVGEYIVTARQKGDTWYIAGITNWDKRDLEIDFSFLPNNKYEATIFKDGVNANKVATDYKKFEKQLSKSDNLKLTLASGGGFAMVLTTIE